MLPVSGPDEDLEDGEIFDDEDDRRKNLSDPGPPGEGETIKSPEDKDKDTLKDIVTLIQRKDEGRRGGLSGSPDRRLDRRPRPRRKRLRDDEDSTPPRFMAPKPNKHRRSRELDRKVDDEVDENEMICMRGGNSPSFKGNHLENHWDRYDSQEEDDDRDLLGRDRNRRREGFSGGNRLARRARLARGGLKRRGRGGKVSDYSVCKFFVQGKCQRGSECPFSHNALPPRKLELCKFYMMDCCAKKDKCLYMHSEFPCKYFHMGQKCFAGKRCKFSHGKMTPQLKNALLKHLESTKDVEFFRPHNRGDSERDRDFSMKDDFGREGGRRNENRHERRERNEPRHSDNRHNSDEDENRTPMPSPQHDSMERDRSSAEKDFRPQISPKRREHRDSGSGDDLVTGQTIPSHLPKKQRELFLRIQQHQRKNEATKSKAEDERKEEDYREENWYSSDEESSGNPLNTILRTLVKGGGSSNSREPSSQSSSSIPPLLPDIDITAVSKLLTSVRETIQQKTEGGLTPPHVPEKPVASHKPAPPPVEEKRSRDPRLRSSSSDGTDVDLRGDVDLRHLPFKPAPPHQAATEIAASLTSHPPMEYILIPINVPKPDYSTVKPHPKYVNDPRLRRYHSAPAVVPPTLVVPPTPNVSADFLSSRDPRTREIKIPLAGDPRRKSVLLNSAPAATAITVDSDLRQPPRTPLIPTFPSPYPPQPSDIDLRLQAHSHFGYN